MLFLHDKKETYSVCKKLCYSTPGTGTWCDGGTIPGTAYLVGPTAPLGYHTSK